MRVPGFEPFAGGVVRAEVAPRVVTPPYDALTVEQRAVLRARDPLSYLGALVDPHDVPDGDHLAQCRAAVSRLVAADVFEQRPPSFYVCRMSQHGHHQTGVVGEVPLAWADEGRLLGHEQTKAPRAAELALYLEVVGAVSSPVVLAHRRDPALSRLLHGLAAAAPPLRSFTLDDGLTVELWPVADEGDADRVRRCVDGGRLYITDGHHRVEAARRNRLGHEDVPGPHQHVLGALFAEEELRVEPFHRIVVPGPGHPATADRMEAALGGAGALAPAAGPPVPHRQGTFGVAAGDRWYRLDVPAGPDELSPGILQRAVLRPVFGIDDPTRDPRLVTVAGTTAHDELAARAAQLGGVAFVLHRVSVAQLMVTADQGRTLPPKSTYFVPKMRSGIFLRHASDSAAAAPSAVDGRRTVAP